MKKTIKTALYIFGSLALLVLVIAIAGMFIDTGKEVSVTDKHGIEQVATEEARQKEATKDPDAATKKVARKDALENLDFMFDKMIKDSKGSFDRVEYEQIKSHFEADLFINDSFWSLTPEEDKEERAEDIGSIVESKFIGSGLVEDGDGVHVTINNVQGDKLAEENFTGGSYDIKK